MILFLFGYPGVGKNYVGKILATQFDFHFWDADLLLTPAMQACIENKQIFSQTMRDEFTQLIIAKTAKLVESHQNLVIAQALFKEQNRAQIAAAFPDAKFILVDAPVKTILARLKQRNNAVDQTYAKKLKLEFEEPMLSYVRITNNTDQIEVIQQLRSILSDIS